MSSMTQGDHRQLRLGIQTLLLPGRSLEEKFFNAGTFGFDAVEVCVGPEFDLAEQLETVQSASENSGTPVAAICTHPIHDPMEGDEAERDRRIAGLIDLINMANQLGANGVVSVPVRSTTALQAASSRENAIQRMSEEIVEVLHRVTERLSEGEAALFLEPLNRYEAWFLNSVEQASDLARRVAHPRVKALADVFHMNIEESSFATPIVHSGALLGHVHVADNNRLEPGAGCLDFGSFFGALRKSGYGGYVSIECFSPSGPKLSGPAEETLPRSAQFMRSVWESQRL